MRLAGVVLCGGRSSRMGRSKAWLPFGPETLLQRVTRILQPVVGPLVVVAAQGQELPALAADVQLVQDAAPDEGPLRGLAEGLATLRGRADAAFVSACDAPFLTAAFVERLASLLGNADACVPFVGGFHHPLASVYRLDVLASVMRLLDERKFQLTGLLCCVPVRIVGTAELADIDPRGWCLRNVNAPTDYDAAVRDAGFVPMKL